MEEIIQLKITLQDTNPSIWRRVLVNKATTFFELHHIIQIAMGWKNCHLFEFKTSNNRIGVPDKESGSFDNDEIVDASAVLIDDVISSPKEKFKYEYDFGDGWEHQVVVEKFLPLDSNENYPACIDGELNCPPEDCGGIPGFYDLLEIIGNKKHPEHKGMLKWIGGKYDPNNFDKEAVNEKLRKFHSSKNTKTAKGKKKNTP